MQQKSNYEKKKKTQNVANSNGDTTWELKIWHTQQLNCDKPQKLKLCQKLKLWWHSNCDEIKKLKLWQNSKTQILTKLKANKQKKSIIRVVYYEHFDTLPTDEMFSGQHFAILAMF